jgi:hypothetical protein
MARVIQSVVEVTVLSYGGYEDGVVDVDVESESMASGGDDCDK